MKSRTRLLHMKPSSALFFLALLPVAALSQNSLPATPNPANLGEAAGLHAGAVAYLQAVKASSCGYAIKHSVPALSQAIRNDIAPVFPQAQRGEVTKLLNDLAQDMQRQGESTLAVTYNYYTQQERLDHNTACGFVAGNAISTRKLTYEAMVRVATEPDWERGIISPPSQEDGPWMDYR